MFQLPKKILFGLDAVKQVGVEGSSLGKKAFVVTDQGVAKSGLLARVEEALESSAIEVLLFDRITREPTLETAEEMAYFARGETFDFVVGFGGGSALDMAKVASIASTNSGSMKEYLGTNLVQRPGKPKILIPTTAGTASEVTMNAVIALPKDETKSSIVTPYNLPDLAIVDPALTVTMPQRITVSTGLDALSHAIEALMSNVSNPLTDALAYEAVTLVSESIRLAYAQPENMQARYGMALASLSAGIAFGNASTCLGHALAYTFAVTYSIPHGLSCGLALPYVIEYNAIACPEKLSRVKEIMGGTKDLNLLEDARGAALNVRELMIDMNAPTCLREVGVPKESIPKMADSLLRISRLLARNPRTVSREEAIMLFERMWEGKLGK